MKRLGTTLVILLIASSCSGGGTSVFDLEKGDCFQDPEDLTQTEIGTVEVVDCSEPHDNEIYYTYSMTESLYPGDDLTLELAEDRCFDQFEPFVGMDYWDSELDFLVMTPTASSWASGDRIVYCYLYALDLSRLEGSMRGSGI